MKISTLYKQFRAVHPSRLYQTFINVFGLIWLFIEPAGLFFPQWLDWGWQGYIGLLIFASVWAIVQNIPHSSVSATLSSPDTAIEVKVGDVFNEPGHLVIGCNDVFDTELGEVIDPASVQGQFLEQIYKNNVQILDEEINSELRNLELIGRKDENKIKGKSWRYPIGTTLALGSPDKRYFLNAYGYMRNDLRVKSTADDIWLSLSALWEKVRLKGHGKQIAIPIIGSSLARTNLPRTALIKLIIISFVTASKKEFISKKLTIVIHPKDLESIDFYAVEDFLNVSCF